MFTHEISILMSNHFACCKKILILQKLELLENVVELISVGYVVFYNHVILE